MWRVEASYVRNQLVSSNLRVMDGWRCARSLCRGMRRGGRNFVEHS